MSGDGGAVSVLLADDRPIAIPGTEEIETAAGTCGPVTVRGPGGTGKSLLLRELAAAHGRRDVPVLELDEVAAGSLPESFALLVDDAHELTPARAEVVAAVLPHPGARVTLAFRPWPRPRPLMRLLAEMATPRRSIVLGHVDRAVVGSWARQLMGDGVSPELVDAVTTEAGGLPGLVRPMLRSLALRRRTGVRSIGPESRPAPTVLVVPDEVVEQLRADLADLDEGTAALMTALAAGTPVDDEVLAEVLHVDVGTAAELIARARATGFVLPDGTLVPLVRRLLVATTPPDSLRSTRRRLLGLLIDRGEEPLALARSLAAEHVRDPRAAQLLRRRAEATLAEDPGLASQLLEEAVSSGAPALAAQRAHAVALTGDLDGALRYADTALADPCDPDRALAAGVTASVLARRGLLRRAADLYRLAGTERTGSAVVALLATGARDEAVEMLRRTPPASGSAPTVLAVSEELAAQGVHLSLRAGPDTAATAAAALSLLTRAAAVLEPVGRSSLLSESPAALAALVALHTGEPGVAESVLQRAVAADLGGPPNRAGHLLLLAWVAMLNGRMARASDLVAQAQGGCARPLEPRDELFLSALRVGIARRTGDAPALARAWERVPEALVRHPMDLFTLLPLGELLVAAARLEDGARLEPQVADAGTLLDRLGNPRVWTTTLHWSGAQSAILAGDPVALKPHAAELMEAARTSPYAAVLARAGRLWLRVLADDVDAEQVVDVAQRLAGVGLSWDGSRLAGQAAVRAADARARATLLGCAREMSDATPADEEAPAGATAAAPVLGALSDREREVARLVVAGQTYREIGGRLYISAKTVEHHVSRIRRRLGAGTRSDLVARLRAELAEGA